MPACAFEEHAPSPPAHVILASPPPPVATHAPHAAAPRYKARVKGKSDYVALKKIKLEAEDEGE